MTKTLDPTIGLAYDEDVRGGLMALSTGQSDRLEVGSRQPAMSWGITPERMRMAVERIVAAANPLRVIAFGSWARGQHGPDSDLDLAVILDEYSIVRDAGPLYQCVSSVRMSMDILASTIEHHEAFGDSLNSVHGDIKREGIILYERDVHGPASVADAA